MDNVMGFGDSKLFRGIFFDQIDGAPKTKDIFLCCILDYGTTNVRVQYLHELISYLVRTKVSASFGDEEKS